MSESHLDRELAKQQAAPFLFSEADLPPEVRERLIGREQKYDDWTAARLFSQKREIYDTIVRMLAAGLHVRLISDLCAVAVKSVVAVREAEPAAVTSFREKLGVRRRNMMARCADNMAAALELNDTETGAKIAKDLSIVWNILDGQDRLDSGAPTQIIRLDEPPAIEEYRRFLAAHTIDVPAEATPLRTGLTGGAPEQRAAPDSPSSPRPGPTSPPPTSHE